MDYTVASIFVLVYLGMITGKIKGLALNRAGVALIGAMALLALGKIDLKQATMAIDASTMALLFGLMVVSAQFRLAGTYANLTQKMAGLSCSAPLFLGLIMMVAGFLSAILANDIVCLAMAPVLVEVCLARKYDPVPFMLGLALAANIGSAATLIGNPQNMLIGQVLRLDFSWYLRKALPVVLVGMVLAWAYLVYAYKGKWQTEQKVQKITLKSMNAWQTVKGSFVLLILLVGFLSGYGDRAAWALGAACILMLTRRNSSQDFFALIDWPLLLLFAGLFIVNHALQTTGIMTDTMARLSTYGLDLTKSGPLFFWGAVLSNIVSNVPAVMLLLPQVTDSTNGMLLALSSTLAGNLFVVGSIANIIVFDGAARLGVQISWKKHASIGVPVTLMTLLVAWVLV